MARADIDHSPWDALLQAHAAARGVDHEGIARKRATLDQYLRTVAEASGELGLAFHINAYDAMVVASILDQGKPAASRCGIAEVK